jgi:caa(3)-type oxidase subunit IV
MAEVTHEIAESAHDDHHSDTVVVLGREITVAGGIYTVIFGALGILTIIEVLLAELLNDMGAGAADGGFLTALKAFLLLGLAVIKSTLVVWFYMHLKDDKRIYVIVVLLPLLIAALSVIFVLAVPPTGYSLTP